MKRLSNLFISDNIVLKQHKLLYISLIKLYGISNYRTKFLTSLNNISTYKNYDTIKYKLYIYFNYIFRNITFNINNFKKKSDLCNRRKYKKLI
ncbi:hypothetical protein BcabD6B2_58840 (apicoplast) [Babesia caballi]|uniref:Ribosomal protein S11 n=1 Tax=Babesia caballi TaxID=5871 RepID=A0AAV4M3J9_BABCB|nr:hypothetical protein BcabD6B2_58840 [Babesia caballi]